MIASPDMGLSRLERLRHGGSRGRHLHRLLDSVSTRLVALIMLSVLPLAALASLLAWHNYETTRDASLSRAGVVAEALTIQSAQQIADTERMLRALSHQPGLQDPLQCTELLRLAKVLKTAPLISLRLMNTDGAVVCGEPVTSVVHRDTARPAVKSEAPVRDTITLRPVLHGYDGHGRALLRLSLDAMGPAGAGILVAEMPLGWARAEVDDAGLWHSLMGPAGETEAWLIGSDGSRVPLCRDCGWSMGRRGVVSKAYDAGSYLKRNMIGDISLLITTVPSKQESLARATFLWRVLAIVSLLAAGMAAVAMGANILIVAPLRAITHSVTEWRRAGAYDPRHTRLTPIELRQLSRAFTQATRTLNAHEERLEKAEAKQELLIKEIHHRVKNNLQIIASLLNLQANRIRQPEAKAEFASARDRVRALATLHRYLYSEGEMHTLNMRSFLLELCGQLFQAIGEKEGRRIRLDIEAPEIVMSTDQAVPLALVVTEAVSNAIKYAFPGGRSGVVSVRLAEETTGIATLVIEDDGVGIPAGRAETEAGIRDGLGIQLIRGFARQLGATLEVVEGEPGSDIKTTGTRYTLQVPLHPKVETYSGPDEAEGASV
ncbi:sensor histidine kinase [Lichenicola cladoniae]|uniref:histidine kinase n=1 Tax=Lichenicola cladoniae TaxID=1484109 RepID=A0A6M8HNL8_9PROT|nr:sensor histidine kinase [Lichenicola cladoniae]NPD67387.1 sensor histidine kinase [Acetobacteraceae bacterium]QKE89881.1 sensor histidine kinase [Lichenicola cladoniae]